MKNVMYKKILFLSSISALTLSAVPGLTQAGAANELALTPTEVENKFKYPVGFGITVSPSMEVSTRYDDNIFLRDKVLVKDSWITELAPSIKVVAGDRFNLYVAEYTLVAGEYHSSHDDDFIDHLFSVSSHNEFNSKNQLNLKFSYDHLHERRGSGLSDGGFYRPNSPDEYNDMTIGGNYIYGGPNADGNIKLHGSYFDRDYTNNEDYTRYYDRDEETIGATFYYRVMPKTSLLFEAEYKDISYDNDPSYRDVLDSDEQKYQVGVTWEATSKTKGTAQIGKTYKNFDKNYKDDDFTSWALYVHWAPLSYSTLDVSTARYPVESTGQGSYIENTEIATAWRHGWSEKISTRLSSRYVQQDYMESGRDDDVFELGLGADFRFDHGVAFSLDYDYTTRDSSQYDADFDDNVFMLSFKLGI